MMDAIAKLLAIRARRLKSVRIQLQCLCSRADILSNVVCVCVKA